MLPLLLALSVAASAQDADSTEAAEEALDFEIEEREYNNDDKPYFSQFDTTVVNERPFSAQEIERMREDPELTYGETRAGVSLWDRFWMWFGQILNDLFGSAATVNWLRLFIYALLLVGLIYVIIRLLKIDAFKIFYGATEAKKVSHLVIDENIHEMDFEKLLADAIQSKEYRLAVRLFFLYGLKMLSDKQHVTWEPGKTNHDYLMELKAGEVKSGFTRLNYYFEYTWYGHFDLRPEAFSQINDLFNQWKGKVQ